MSIAKILLLSAVLFGSLSACQKAVKAPEKSSYIIMGNKQSALYPLEVKQNSEDVFITLAPHAPLPEISSYDASGNKIIFNFSIVDNTILVPGKFEHLSLSQADAGTIDIIRQDHN